MFATGNIIRGRYRLDEAIGEGGMATIWRAVHVALQRPVAIKFVHPDGPEGEAIIDRFLREARLAAAIRHVHVVDILDFGTAENGVPFMVMELLEGESLAQRLGREYNVELPELVRMFAQVLSGLAAVHQAGIIHRDLKPENVFLVRDPDGDVVKLLDFGVSRTTRTASRKRGLRSVLPSYENLVAGTPHYMAPEQARGVADLDLRVDLYAAGVMFYEALAGRLPFDHENVGDLLQRIMTEDAPSLSFARPDLTGPIADWVDRALSRDRDHRFADAREMRRALLDAARASGVGVDASRPDIVISDRPPAQEILPPAPISLSQGVLPSPLPSRDDDATTELLLTTPKRRPGAPRGPSSHPPIELQIERDEDDTSVLRRRSRLPFVGALGIAAAAIVTALVGAGVLDGEATANAPSDARAGAAQPVPIAPGPAPVPAEPAIAPGTTTAPAIVDAPDAPAADEPRAVTPEAPSPSAPAIATTDEPTSEARAERRSLRERRIERERRARRDRRDRAERRRAHREEVRLVGDVIADPGF